MSKAQEAAVQERDGEEVASQRMASSSKGSHHVHTHMHMRHVSRIIRAYGREAGIAESGAQRGGTATRRAEIGRHKATSKVGA